MARQSKHEIEGNLAELYCPSCSRFYNVDVPDGVPVRKLTCPVCAEYLDLNYGDSERGDYFEVGISNGKPFLYQQDNPEFLGPDGDLEQPESQDKPTDTQTL